MPHQRNAYMESKEGGKAFGFKIPGTLTELPEILKT